MNNKIDIKQDTIEEEIISSIVSFYDDLFNDLGMDIENYIQRIIIDLVEFPIDYNYEVRTDGFQYSSIDIKDIYKYSNKSKSKILNAVYRLKSKGYLYKNPFVKIKGVYNLTDKMIRIILIDIAKRRKQNGLFKA